MPFIISQGFKKYSEIGGKAEKLGPVFSAVKALEIPIYPPLPDLKNVSKQVASTKVGHGPYKQETINEKISIESINRSFANMENFYQC
jgi:hypothetical protein